MNARQFVKDSRRFWSGCGWYNSRPKVGWSG